MAKDNPPAYSFREFYIPPRMMPSLIRYIDDGVLPGNFLVAVLSNNLKDACGSADDENLRNIPAYVAFLYNEAPANCWGSRKIVDAWIVHKQMQREQKEGL